MSHHQGEEDGGGVMDSAASRIMSRSMSSAWKSMAAW
jgi:hypothetical protein